jgi:hypothetical protein
MGAIVAEMDAVSIEKRPYFVSVTPSALSGQIIRRVPANPRATPEKAPAIAPLRVPGMVALMVAVGRAFSTAFSNAGERALT